MLCERARPLLGPYRDRELGENERRELEAHLAICGPCREVLAGESRTALALRTFARFEAPPELVRRIGADLDRAGEAPLPALRKPVNGLPFLGVRARRLAAAAAVVLACVLSALAGWWAADRPSRIDIVEHDVVTAHLRSLLQDRQVEVASSDQHTVRPWFAGRAEFAPPVRSFAGEGFPLLGGRVDYVAGRRVAAIVYKRRLHVVNVFMWPDPASPRDAPARTVSRNGYNIVSLRKSGVRYWLVSDLNVEELGQLADLL